MKKLLCLFLVLSMSFCLFACGNSETQKNIVDTTATDADIATLEGLYQDLQVHHGQLHEHSDSGRRSDGKHTLAEWKENMPSVDMEYVALLDHRQTDHMYHEDWDSSLFISGTEAMTYILDRNKLYNKYHYNMIFNHVSDMEALLYNHEETYKFSNGLFRYRSMTSVEFIEIIQEVQASGGYFVIAHPGQTLGEVSEDPLEYYYCDGIGYEVFYHLYGNPDARDLQTQINYKIYTGLLAAGKKVYASSGSDVHSLPTDRGLSTIYSSQRQDTAYIEQLRKGNYTAGPVGVRMCIGDSVMGSTTDFDGQRIVVSVGDFHQSFSHGKYQLKLISDKGEVCTVDIPSTDTCYFAFDADESAKFYRVEVHDTTQDYTLLAMGNPIWND